MLHYLADPYIQTTICCVIMLAMAIFSKLDVGVILMTGMWIGILFLPSSLFYGVYFNQTWTYLLHLLLATIVFSGLWVLLAVIADKFGTPIKNGEGMMMLMMPVTVYPVIFVFAVVSKLIFDLLRGI